MKVKIHLLLVPLLALTLVATALLAPQTATTVRSGAFGNNILARNMDIELGRAQPGPHEQLLSSGVIYTALQASGELDRRAAAVARTGRAGPAPLSSAKTLGCQNGFNGGGVDGGRNIRVNQDCSLRRQAEEVIAVNPNNPRNLIAGQNDSRIGFNHCGYDWSFDGGNTWGDQVPPFWQFQLLDGHTADACSDPSVTFDANGNAYITGILFDITSAANAIVVAKSNAGIGGAFYHSPAPGAFQTYSDVPLGIVANDNNPNIAHDKEFIVADANRSSPKKNNVYLTWTRFTATNAPIYFSQSTNGGATWSPGVEISGANAAICTAGSGGANPNACDQNQGSDPVVGPDGTVYVSFFNQNTPVASNQHLVVKCPAANDCSLAASWSAPSKITDDFGGQPLGPNAVTGCPAGRRCLPPNGYRVQDRTYGSLSVDGSGKLYFVFSDFRNGGPPCTGPATTATPPCDQDVFYSFSTNSGAAWSAAVKLTPAGSAQWQSWSAVAPSGGTLWAGYYDRSYGNCEFDGCNDITLVGIRNPASASPSFSYKRLTTSSMPNLVVANNPLQAGFLGDYMWVTVDARGNPFVVWGDTRGLNGTVEEDVYFATVGGGN
jgi:hypothetical protein